MKKSIFLFFAAILCATSAWGKDVYAVNYSLPGNGSNTYCHNWQNENTNTTSWPGTKMTKTSMKAGSNDIYMCTLKAATNNKVIFSNNGSSQSNTFTLDSKYPQPTYANGSWWYSPRITSAIWGDAQNVSGGYIYFDNTQAQWEDTYIYLVVGHDTYLGYYRLTKLDGTNLYYASLKDLGWGDAKFVVMAGHSSSKSKGSESANTIASLNHFSDAISYGLNTGTSYMITMESGTNCTPISIDWNNDGYSKYNSSQTIYKVIDNVTTSENVGTVSITTTKLSGDCKGDKNNSTVTIADNNEKASTDAVLTATVTLTASANAGYEFLGWAEAADGTIVNTNATLTYTATAKKSYYAKYQKIYTVTINNDGNGSTNPSGTQSNITEKDGISISADAAENFAFTSWTIVSGTGTFDAQSSASTKFYPTSNATIKATFHSTITNSLSVVAGANVESVDGSTDPIALGESYEIKATPAYGYRFNQWTADPAENATFGSATTAETTVTVNNGSVTVTASATEILAELTTANAFDAGTPSIDAPTASATKIGVATTATITATEAPSGYTFVGWTLTNCERTDGGADNATEITVKSTGTDAEATVTAKYEIDKYYVVGSFNGWNTKDVNYEMTFDNGVYKKTVTFVKDVEFKICNGSWGASWSYENLQSIEYKELVKSDDKDKNIKLTKDATFTIIFDLSKNFITFEGLNEKYTYVLMGVNKDWTTGIVMERNPNNTHERMLTCQPIEKANDAIKVAILEEGKDAVYCDAVADHSVSHTRGEHNNIVLEDGVYDFYYKIDENKVYIGSTTCIPTFEISATAENGTVDGTGTYDYKETATLKANPAEGYHFVKWSNESTTNPLNIVVTEDVELQAIFAINTYTVTATATEGGAVIGDGTYNHGETVTLTATANEGYKFVNWTKEGEEVSTDATYTFTATKDVTLTANFELKSYTITATAENGTVEGAGVYNHGATVTLTATANEGYKFVNWTKGGEIVSTEATYTFTATEDAELVANFKATIITLTTGNNDAVIAANIGNTVDVVIERSFTADDGYYTLCVPFNMPASVIGKAYSLGTVTEHVAGEGININLKEENELSAGMPYLVLPKANMSELVVEDVTIAEDDIAGQGVSNEEGTVNIFFQGYYSAPGVTTNGTTQYYVGNNGYLYNGKVEIRGLSGLFTITNEAGNPTQIRARVVAGENVETGVEDIITTDAPVKVIENGQLIIIRGGVKYNVQGVRL